MAEGRALHLISLLACGGAFAWAFLHLSHVLMPFILSAALAYVTTPLINHVEIRGLRENARRRIVVQANTQPGADMGKIVEAIRENVAAASLPNGYTTRLEGSFQAQAEASRTIGLLSLLSLALVPRVRRQQVPWFDLGLIALAALWAVYSLRTVPVAACMAAPLAAAGVQGSLGSRPRVRRAEVGVVMVALVGGLATLGAVVPTTADEPRTRLVGIDRALADLPAETLIAILENNLSAGLLNRFNSEGPLVERSKEELYNLVLERVVEPSVVRSWNLIE